MTEEKPPAKGVQLTDPPEGNKGSGRYAVYDRQLAQFRTGVSDAKPDKAAVDSHGPYAVLVEV
jgi:hypothetical protein